MLAAPLASATDYLEFSKRSFLIWILFCSITQIFQPRNRDSLMIMEFVAGTAAILRKKGRLQQFVFLADRSIELLQGNLMLKK